MKTIYPFQVQVGSPLGVLKTVDHTTLVLSTVLLFITVLLTVTLGVGILFVLVVLFHTVLVGKVIVPREVLTTTFSTVWVIPTGVDVVLIVVVNKLLVMTMGVGRTVVIVIICTLVVVLINVGVGKVKDDVLSLVVVIKLSIVRPGIVEVVVLTIDKIVENCVSVCPGIESVVIDVPCKSTTIVEVETGRVVDFATTFVLRIVDV